MKMDEVVSALELARDTCICGFIEVTIPGQDATETIVNWSDSLDNKIEYYKGVYDENGRHRMNDRIRIVNAGGCKPVKNLT